MDDVLVFAHSCSALHHVRLLGVFHRAAARGWPLPEHVAGAVVVRGPDNSGNERIEAFAVDERDRHALPQAVSLLTAKATNVRLIARGSGRSDSRAWARVGTRLGTNWHDAGRLRASGEDRRATEGYLAELLSPFLQQAAEQAVRGVCAVP